MLHIAIFSKIYSGVGFDPHSTIIWETVIGFPFTRDGCHTASSLSHEWQECSGLLCSD